ncbi:MAG TPA: hypothetical protein VM735_07630 [Candidatus Kapabacteria bacterium]|nr:hypothetical protein [Candidatus Kapabacteria bacterium]
MSRFSKAIVAIALALSIGVQWPLLQSIAWLNMLVTYSAQEGIQQAVVKTFDGNHPCKICKFVDEGKQAEKKDTTQQTLKKLDPMILASFEIRIDKTPSQPAQAPASFCEARIYPPLSPPPDLV